MTPSELRQCLAANGYALLPKCTLPHDPWQAVASLLGERPQMVERQMIRPIEGGQSFASSRAFTPLHTDSQDYRGVSPLIQVMECRRAADEGGETILLDSFDLYASISRTDPTLAQHIRLTPRSQHFYFGNIEGPTLGQKGAHVVFTHSPVEPADNIGNALKRAFQIAPLIELKASTGDVLVVDNHRMLHGRRLFKGEREFLRLLAWFRTPLYTRAVEPFAPAPVSAESESQRRARVVLELLTGMSPALLSKREGISEATLYKWRNLAAQGAERAVVD